MLLEGQLVALVVIGVFPELSDECVIAARVLFALPELAVDAFEDRAGYLEFVVLHDVGVAVAHRLHALAVPDYSQLFEDVDCLLEHLLAQ